MYYLYIPLAYVPEDLMKNEKSEDEEDGEDNN